MQAVGPEPQPVGEPQDQPDDDMCEADYEPDPQPPDTGMCSTDPEADKEAQAAHPVFPVELQLVSFLLLAAL